MENSEPENPVPVNILRTGAQLQCKWLATYDKRFTEPFFSNTIFSCRMANGKQKSPNVSSLAEMKKQGEKLDAVSPAAIIFHISRCGSTLVSQLFATSPRFIVLSEVPFFDELLRLSLTAGYNQTEISSLFLPALNLYGKKKDEATAHVIIKTDSWHIFFYDILRHMFPLAPFVLMYRDPAEVLTSHMKIPGSQTIPELVAPQIFGLPGMPELYIRDAYTAEIIEKLLGKFLDVAQKDSNTLLVNYNEEPVPAIKKIAAFAGLKLDQAELDAMAERARYHSKRAGEFFNEDKYIRAPGYLDPAMPIYNFLEAMRTQ